MCGFFGFICKGKLPADEVLKAASSSVAYRGRDEYGSYKDPHCYFAHYRLSIIDLCTGQQPMKDIAGRYVIVFNGELYNYLELREELESKGYRFATKSDTEVFLVGVICFGKEFLKKAEGMFSAAIWDTLELTLTLVRDPQGKKPLYVWNVPGQGVAISSNISSFKIFPGWGGKINRASIVHYLITSVIPAPMSIYSDVRKVMPGSIEVLSRDGSWTKATYDFIDFGKSRKNVKEEEILRDINRAISIRLRADVPIGMLFSGGVDSGLLACLIKEMHHEPLLFNIDYESVGNESPERRNARIAAKRLEFKMIEENFIPESIFTNLADAYRYYDEPCSHIPMVYYYQILKNISRHGIKVVLAGNGADELFFGYRGNKRIRFISDALRLVLRTIPANMLPWQIRMMKMEGWAEFMTFYRREKAKVLAGTLGWNLEEILSLSEDYLATYKTSLTASGLSKYSDYVLLQNLPSCGAANYLLPDIGGMQAGVEVRSPFLDWHFVNLVASIPEKMRIGSYFSDRKNKAVLKRLYARRLGRDLAYDLKRGMGWNIRWDMWIVHEPRVRDFFEKSLRVLSDYDIDPSWFLEQFRRYCFSNKFNAPGGGDAISGFMLALWLKKEMEGGEFLEEWLSEIKGFKPSGVYK